MPVKVKDLGAKKLLNTMKRMRKGMTVRVGIMGSEAAEKKTGGEGLTVAQVASFHEFGLGVPRRSMIRDYHDQNIAAIKKRIEHESRLMLLRKTTGAEIDAMRRLGLFIQDGMVSRIEDGISPALSDETKDRKGSDTPLIDTGQLKSSFTYEVSRGRS